MPHTDRQLLADLEELALRIPNQTEQQYFGEAVQCYFSGALRAAVVLAWIVTTDNLFGKLAQLAREDGDAAKRFKPVNDKRDGHQSYEEELIDAFGPSALGVYTVREIDQLKYVRERRNWCAHASDYRPAPEEARSCLRLVVDIVLSRPTLRGHVFVRQLEADVKDPAFLPDKGYESVVANYLSKLRPELHLVIVQRLLDIALDTAATSATKENVRKFLGGLLARTRDDAQLQRVAAELPKVITASPDLARGIVAHRPEAYRYLEFEYRERLFRFILEGALSDEDQTLLTALARIEFGIGKHAETLTAQLKEKILSLPQLVKQNPAEFSQVAFDVVVERLEYLGANNYHVNNPAAEFLAAAGFDTFDRQDANARERLLRALAASAFDGARGPRQLILNAGKWPSDWLGLLVAALPAVVTKTYLGSHSYGVFTTPLTEWARRGNTLPTAWLPLLAPAAADDRMPKWYGFPGEALLKQMVAVEKAFSDNGHVSAELKAFNEGMSEELNKQQQDNIPF
jgi:hypothetical protein